MITNAQSNTRVDEVASGIYRISTPVTTFPGGFSFHQYLGVDDAPLLFHTGPRGMFPLTREAIAAVMPVERLRYIGFSHFENDESGALSQFLAVAPEAAPLCGRINAMVNGDSFDRAARVLADGEDLSLGARARRAARRARVGRAARGQRTRAGEGAGREWRTRGGAAASQSEFERTTPPPPALAAPALHD